MLYNLLESKTYRSTAGKITLATALSGLFVVALVFLFNAGKTELMKVEAQDSATTTLTVLNTPPQWVASSTELVESSVDNPTNSGDLVRWTAIANDPNQANYYLLICSTSATPSSTNGGAPVCNGGVQWGVSAPTPVNTAAIVSTTTTEVSPFAYSNDWFAWICDDDAINARCNSSFTNGTNATNSSPFIVNFRPVFDTIVNSSPADPGASVLFTSSSTDPNGDTIELFVCSTNSYSTTTGCAATTLASTAVPMLQNATATYVLPMLIQDDVYDAFVFIEDEFNHLALGGAQGTNSQVTVNNVAPTVSNININNGTLAIAIPAAETTGFNLSFTTTDANSCRTSADDFEIIDYTLSLYRSGIGSSSCNGVDAGQYNPNNCYTGAAATTTWNLTCTASTTSCTAGGGDSTMDWSCSFPLWFITDPTDPGSQYEADNWLAAISGVDDDLATGTLAISGAGAEVTSLIALDLLSASIPYGQLEPGQNSGTLNASTTVLAVGNTGIDQNLEGESMCTTFSVGNECVSSASSTIPESEQQFATSSVSYGSGTALSSSTVTQLELNVPKSTSTTTPSSGVTYWGINVPSSITLAGSYTGLNTFAAVVSEALEW